MPLIRRGSNFFLYSLVILQFATVSIKVYVTFALATEAWWHIGMSSASHQEDPGSNPGKGENY